MSRGLLGSGREPPTAMQNDDDTQDTPLKNALVGLGLIDHVVLAPAGTAITTPASSEAAIPIAARIVPNLRFADTEAPLISRLAQP